MRYLATLVIELEAEDKEEAIYKFWDIVMEDKEYLEVDMYERDE